MTFLQNTVLEKPWYFLRKYILTIPRFDLFLQGTLLIVTLLETNVLLLIRRNDESGYIRSITEDWVIIGAGGAQFLLGGAVAWLGSNRRQFALSTWLAITAFSSLMILAFPFAESRPPSVELCGGNSISAYKLTEMMVVVDFNQTPRTVFLIITAVVCSLSKISIWAHGLTYLDDHEPQNGPYFYGILISIQLSLGLNGWSWLQPGSMREDWWEAHLSLGMLTLMFAILFTLFPKRMPEHKMLVEEEYCSDYAGLMPTLVQLCCNKVYVLQTLALALLYTGLFGFIHLEDAYVQARFHVESLREDPRTSRAIIDIFRSLVIIFFVTIFRMRFSVRRTDGVKANTASRVGGVVAIFAAVFFAVLIGLGCNLNYIAGTNGNYVQPACSLDCGCNSENYGFSPVCLLDNNALFFSPCHAGCNKYEDFNGFLLLGNCTCGVDSQRAIRGSCGLPGCQSAFSFYLLFFTLVLAVSGASCLMQGMVILRSVKRIQKPIAMGASFGVIALLSQVLGHLLFMAISNATCAYKSMDVCILHHSTIWIAGVTSIALTLLSAIVSIIVSVISKPRLERGNGTVNTRY